MAGFQNNGLTSGPSVWLPPVIGPIVGGLLGAFAYDLFIGRALVQAHELADNPEDRPSGEDSSYTQSGSEHREVARANR
jgi:hypothetical protein